MRRRVLLRVAACAALLAAGAPWLTDASAATSGGTTTGGTTAGAPRRLVSLGPNITEILFAVGAGGDLVGVTDQCDFPAEAKAKAKVGSYVSPSLEGLVTLRPTTVFATEGNNRDTVERLKARGVEVVEVNPRRASELAGAVRLVASKAGRAARGEEIAAGVEAGLARLRAGTPKGKRHLLVLQVDPLISVSDDSWLGDVFKEAGFVNVVGDSKVRYPVVSDELLALRGPDVVFAAHEVDAGRLKAKTRKAKVVRLPADVFVRPGPRIVEAFDFLAAYKAGETGGAATGAATAPARDAKPDGAKPDPAKGAR